MESKADDVVEEVSPISRQVGLREGEVVVDGAAAHEVEELINGVKYAFHSQVVGILDRVPGIANAFDSQGNSSAHWAAKRGDVEILRMLSERGADFNRPTAGDAKMMPLHWAASEGRIGALRFLLQHRADINAQDGNRCTAVIIAAQHDQPTAVAFLLKNGADMGIVDKNGDNALHWAAYKGLVEIAGLVSHCCPQALEQTDVFGQTPLHLAALRCHEEVIEYLVVDCGADMSKQDKNGMTALDLSVKKSPLEVRQLKCEWVLRRLSANSFFDVVSGYARPRFKDLRLLSIIIFGIHEREWGKWPWRIVFVSNVLGSVTAIRMAISESLGDLYMLHLMNTICYTIFWICFALLLQKNSALVREDSDRNSPSSYDSALTEIGNAISEHNTPSLCHSCHILKPLRSKHCKFQRRCTNRFDHFCPFVYNTVSRDNYKYFYVLLLAQFVGSICWDITVIYLAMRVRISWMFTFFVLYHFMWFLMIAGLLQYHTMLTTQALTTNEHVGMAKYSYLRNEMGQFDNPFSKGEVWSNVLDTFFPSAKQYYSRQEVLKEKFSYLNSSGKRGHSSHEDSQRFLSTNV